MQRLMTTLAAVALILGTMAIGANAQNHQFGAGFHALKNATPIYTPAGCRGFTGGCGCGPGFISACRDRCCRCVPC